MLKKLEEILTELIEKNKILKENPNLTSNYKNYNICDRKYIFLDVLIEENISQEK